MSSSLIVAFDVGGTQIKAAAVVDGAIVEATVGYYPARSDLPAGDWIAHAANLFGEVLAKAGTDAAVDGFGLAFPGPFDYAAGVSRIRGLGKFEPLYGLPVGRLLQLELQAKAAVARRLAPHFRIAFENDAALFGLGESAPGGAAHGAQRAICLTIGTGLGSCFLERGQPVRHRADVPGEGWLYDAPYEGSIADDYISRRGVLGLAADMGPAAAGLDVRELAELAEAGDAGARRVFERFGQRLAQILLTHVLPFRPDVIVLGGQISRSAPLFVPSLANGLRPDCPEIAIRVSRSTLAGTLRGIHAWMTSRQD